MLDAFGKGASEDIQLAKSELYSQMTWDKDSKSSSFAEPQVTTPLPSPPPSPKPRKASLEDTSESKNDTVVLRLVKEPTEQPSLCPTLCVALCAVILHHVESFCDGLGRAQGV